MRPRFPSGFLKWIATPLNKKFPFRGPFPATNMMIQQVINLKLPRSSFRRTKRLHIIDIKNSATDLTLSQWKTGCIHQGGDSNLKITGLLCLITLYGPIKRLESFLLSPKTKGRCSLDNYARSPTTRSQSR